MKIKMLILLSVLLSFFSCTTKKAPAPDTNVTITTGTWRISFYFNSTDETGNFSAYSFMFNNDGSFMAHTNTSMVTGTWSETSTKLTINLGTDPVLSKLNHNWLKTEKTSSSLKLKDDNPSSNEQVYFVKN